MSFNEYLRENITTRRNIVKDVLSSVKKYSISVEGEPQECDLDIEEQEYGNWVKIEDVEMLVRNLVNNLSRV